MNHPITQTAPAEVYRHGLSLLRDRDLEGWAALCDEQVIFEFPFAPPGRPRRLEGRAAVADYLHRYPGRIELDGIPELTIHQTLEADTIIVEMGVTGRVAATGAPYEMSYITVVVIRDGLITRYRDYWNPLTSLAPVGGAR